MADLAATPVNSSQLFFLVITPGFENLALYELHRKIKQIYSEWEGHYTLHPGGIEIPLPLDMGLELNHHLRIPTRILLRCGTKKDLLLYQDFQKWLRTLNLERYLPFGEVYVSTRSSKLKMKEKLKNVFLNSFQFQTKPKGTPVYIRFFRDECTVSVNTSGEDLYQRGQEKWTGEAPLRETMASGLLQLSVQGIDDLSQWTLIDPMVGSGTFLLEGAQLNQPLSRAFSFETWAKTIKTRTDNSLTGFRFLRGQDKDPKCVDIARKNLNMICKNFEVTEGDVFSLTKAQAPYPCLVIVNPPYGKRLKLDRKDYYTDLLNHIVLQYQPERLGLLVPRDKIFQKPQGYEQVRHLYFSNNGIDVGFYLFTKETKQLISK